jgi:origin recognition complex subunit 1
VASDTDDEEEEGGAFTVPASDMLQRVTLHATEETYLAAAIACGQATGPRTGPGRPKTKGVGPPAHIFSELAVDAQKGVFWAMDWNAVQQRGAKEDKWELLEEDGAPLKDPGMRPPQLREAVKEKRGLVDPAAKPKPAKATPKPKAAKKTQAKTPKSAAKKTPAASKETGTPKRKPVVLAPGTPIHAPESLADMLREAEVEEDPFWRSPSAPRASHASTSAAALEPITPRRRMPKLKAAPAAAADADAEMHSASGGSDDDEEGSVWSGGDEAVSEDEDADTAATSEEDDEDSSDEEFVGDILTRNRKRRGGKRGGVPRTPTAKRFASASAAGTPRSRGIATPNRRSILDSQARAAPYPTLPARAPQVANVASEELSTLTPHARARRLLHVGATPSQLPCRGDEFEEILSHVEDAVQDGVGGCVYVAGVPGTGKTATVREVVRALTLRADAGLVSPFNFVEINGMKLPDASQAYSLLWAAVGGGSERAAAPKTALKRLADHFAAGGAGRATTVVLMDELDQLVTARQDVVYNFFNWPSMRGSRLIVLAVANTMDLPERTLNAKVASRLGMTRIPFEPYRSQQLAEIVQTRLGMLPPGTAASEEQVARAKAIGCDQVMHRAAIEYASKRIANVSGDARRMLDVCRRGVELVEARALTAAPATAADGSAAAAPAAAAVQPADMIEILSALVKSGKVAHVRALPLHAKMLLISLLSVLRRSGLAEASVGDVFAHHRVLCTMHGVSRGAGLPGTASHRDPWNADELAAPLSSLCAMGLAIAVGTGAGPGRAAVHGRLMLACQEDEVRLALEADQDERLRKML